MEKKERKERLFYILNVEEEIVEIENVEEESVEVEIEGELLSNTVFGGKIIPAHKN